MSDLSSNFYTQCEVAIKKAARDKATAIAYGNAESYSEYKQECGVIVGLELALNILEEVLTTVSKEN